MHRELRQAAGIGFSWPVALAIVLTLGALLGSVVGHAISRLAERATPQTRGRVLFGVMVLLIVLVGVAGGRFLQ